jgi:hypothetical protein
VNRRNFIQGLAAIAAGPVPPAVAEGASLTGAVNLASPGASQYIARPEVDLFADMEEPYPCDHGEPSGARLTIIWSGEIACLDAQIGNHFLGCLQEIDDPGALKAGLKSLLRGQPVPMGEFYGDGSNRFSGAELKLASGELQLNFGPHHCFGVLRGELLATFMSALQFRTEDARA